MWQLEYKVEHQRTDDENPLDCKEIKLVSPKGNQSWILIGRTDAKAEAPILWPPDAKSRFIEKTLVLGKIEGRRRRGQQRMRWLDVHESEQTLGDSEGQGSLVFCSPWVAKNQTWLSDWTTNYFVVIMANLAFASVLKNPCKTYKEGKATIFHECTI